MKKSFISILILILCIYVIMFTSVAAGQPLLVENPTPEVVEHSEKVYSGLVFIPSSHDFNTVGVTDNKTYNFQLKNNGSTSTSEYVNLFGNYQFSCISGCTYNLNPTQSQYVTIRFTPCKLGEFDTVIYAGSAQATATGEGTWIGAWCD